MTDREKLIDMLESVEHARRLYPDLYVDMLIANGVVVREKGEWKPEMRYDIGGMFGFTIAAILTMAKEDKHE